MSEKQKFPSFYRVMRCPILAAVKAHWQRCYYYRLKVHKRQN